MPRAEVGTIKHLANRMKSKGLQRLRWYCTPCNKQCRDENGFKCHVNSESHVRQMQILGEDPKKAINDYSDQFQRAFLQQLRTAHGTKFIHINHFYQEYIADKEHIHMNATRWPSLTEFAKHLGRAGLCRVEETEKGILLSWVDNSPEALRRQDASKKRERMDRGDEEREQRLIQGQIDRASGIKEFAHESEMDLLAKSLQREHGQRFRLNFITKTSSKLPSPPCTSDGEGSGADIRLAEASHPKTKQADIVADQTLAHNVPSNPSQEPTQIKSKNVFKFGSKKHSTTKQASSSQLPKKMSEVERIAREGLGTLKRKRGCEANWNPQPDEKKYKL